MYGVQLSISYDIYEIIIKEKEAINLKQRKRGMGVWLKGRNGRRK